MIEYEDDDEDVGELGHGRGPGISRQKGKGARAKGWSKS